MVSGNKNSYEGKAAQWLLERGVELWDQVTIKSKTGKFKGTLLPRSKQGDDQHVVIKLTNGYNIGLAIENISEIEVSGKIEASFSLPDKKVVVDPEKPTIVILGTGGTVASKIDYRTGAVRPAFSPQELFNAIPELVEICNLETKTVFQTLSENIIPENWITLANEIVNTIDTINPRGIVITHGTDTMHYTAAALSFMLQELNCPIVLVGSQRSSDRPSSDAALNLLRSVQFAANSNFAEVVICMHGASSDDYNIIHRGTRVRKMHTSRRDAFKTIGDVPLAKIAKGEITSTNANYRRIRSKRPKTTTDTRLDEKVGLIYSHPGMKKELLDYFIDNDYSGLVIAGTGLGHIDQKLLPSIKRANEEQMCVFMASQCLWGFTGLNVYETGRLLLQENVIPVGNMLPEVALVKAMWVLGHTKEVPFVKELMLKNLAGELTNREQFDEYLILQSQIDGDVNEFLKRKKQI